LSVGYALNMKVSHSMTTCFTFAKIRLKERVLQVLLETQVLCSQIHCILLVI
jgi:hypothetical protein